MSEKDKLPREYYIGIDLGKTGGIACIDNEMNTPILMPMPSLIETQISTLTEIIAEILEEDPFAYISITMEQTSPRPQEGVKSVATFARHCGGIYYTCMGLHLKYKEHVFPPQRIAPILWKKRFGLINKKLSKYEKKKIAVDFVNKEWNMNLKYSQNGMADALLIALYSKLEVEDVNRKC